jgi:DNA-directed RNA polymerase subunit RPC12/RpoP
MPSMVSSCRMHPRSRPSTRHSTSRKTRPAQRLSPIKPPGRCPHCNSKRLIKKGTRKKKLEDVPLYRCRSCGRTFSIGPRAIRNKTYPLPEILEAFTLHDRGNTLEETADKISSRHGHQVAPSTISRWVSEHPTLTTYRRLRDPTSPRGRGAYGVVAEGDAHAALALHATLGRARRVALEVPPPNGGSPRAV